MFRKRNSLKCSGLTQQRDAFGVTSSTTWERLEMFCGSLCKNTLSCVLVRLGSGESSLFKSNFLLVTSIFVTLWQCAHALTLASFHTLWHFPVSTCFDTCQFLDTSDCWHSARKETPTWFLSHTVAGSFFLADLMLPCLAIQETRAWQLRDLNCDLRATTHAERNGDRISY